MRFLIVLACLLAPALPVAAQTPADTAALLTLDEAIRTALDRNYGIQVARGEVEIARNNVSRGNAGYLPTVGVTAAQTYTGDPLLGGTATRSGTAQAFDLTAAAGYTVFDGFAREATFDRLRALRTRAEVGALGYTEATLADVITFYFDVARQQQQLVVLREAVAISEERLRIAEVRRDLGSASEMEVRRARVDLNADRAALLRQQAVLAGTKGTLNQALGRDTNASFRVADTLHIDPTLRLDALRTEALRHNKALRLAESDRLLAETARREVRAEWYPQVDLTLGYRFNDITSEMGLPVSRPGGLTYGLTARFDVFEGFNRRRRMQNALIDLRNRELEIEETRAGLFVDLETAFTDYRNGLELVALEEENEQLAAQNVQVGIERFRLGGISSIELREVQTALTSARSRLVAARFDAKRAEVRLRHLAGLLVEADS